MVNKTIHYCWYGRKKKPESVMRMIASWKKYCPDYEIIEWNEENSNLRECKFVEEAYQSRKYAFVADYIRMKVLYDYGGVYLDTDVELTKNLDEFLKNDMTIGFQDDTYINTGLIIVEQKNKIIKEMLDYYQKHHFIKQDATLDMTTNVIILTNILKKYGLNTNNTNQNLDGIIVLKNDYFSPLNFRTRKMTKTKNTYAIHWFEATWLPKNKKIQLIIKRWIRRIIGEERYNRIKG